MLAVKKVMGVLIFGPDLGVSRLTVGGWTPRSIVVDFDELI